MRSQIGSVGVRRVAVLVLALSLLVFPAGPLAAAPAEQASCTYRATFISDVTVPDNTVMPPGTTFIKTWRLRNDGTCAWGPGQPVDSVMWVGGTQLSTQKVVPLSTTIWPGQAGEISVSLVAPTTAGTYRSDWMLRRSNGTVFGLNASGLTPFYVQIVVRGSGPPPPTGQRIRFASGSTVGSVQGSVTFPQRRNYLVGARAGQEMTVAIVSPHQVANFSIQGVTDLVPYKRLENEDRIFSVVLTMTQDYLISVAVPGGSTQFILSLAISP